jgi:putative membrane protein
VKGGVALLLPLISTIFIGLSAIFVALGWVVIAKRKIEQHKKMMFLGAIFAIIFFITYVAKTVFVGSTAFGGPEEVKIYYTIFLIFHIILATTAAVLGIITLISGYKNNLKLHRKLGPLTSVIWFFSASSGIAVFFLLYVIYPPGEVTNVFRAIWGF